tara:strand:+ start:1277 stop:1867 length:591 start_codon:yes stop_codon:yes gene_type:complete
MKSVYNFVVKPIGERYNNKKKVGNSELIINTEISNHQYVNRLAKVISTPIVGETEIKAGDEVITHFNVFRRWYNVRGKEKNSRSYFDKDTYFITSDQIFLYKRDSRWKTPKGYCFIQPMKDKDQFNIDIEKPLMGIVKYTDGTVDIGDVIGYVPKTECEFVIDGKKLYRVLSNLITIKYGHQGDEETYNPSWAQGG